MSHGAAFDYAADRAAPSALVTYITKDEEVHRTVERFIDGSIEAFKTVLAGITPEQAGTRWQKNGRGVLKATPPPKKGEGCREEGRSLIIKIQSLPRARHQRGQAI